MEKYEISMSFNLDLNKTIFKQSPWNTSYQDFLEETILNHIHEDKLISRDVKKLPKSEQEQYSGFLKTIDNISKDIMKSVSYTLLEENENTQKITISFNFNFYESEKYSLKDFINNYIFENNINANEVLAKNMLKMGKGVPKEKVDLAINIFTHVVDILKEGKKNMVVTQEGEVIDVSNKKKSKKKM